MAIKRQAPRSRSKVQPAEVLPEFGVSEKAGTRSGKAVERPKVIRSQTPPPETYQSGAFLSREEKRQIILAHANLRKPHDPLQMMSVWAGVAVCLVMVAVGWWWTVRPEISKQFDGALKPAMAQASDELAEMKELMGGMKQGGFTDPLNAVDAKVKLLKEQALAQKKAMDAMSDMMDKSASGTEPVGSRDIFGQKETDDEQQTTSN